MVVGLLLTGIAALFPRTTPVVGPLALGMECVGFAIGIMNMSDALGKLVTLVSGLALAVVIVAVLLYSFAQPR